METKQVASGGILLPLLLVLFVGLKLAGIISWPWLWVLAPLWIPFGIALAVFLIVFLVLVGREVMRRP